MYFTFNNYIGLMALMLHLKVIRGIIVMLMKYIQINLINYMWHCTVQQEVCIKMILKPLKNFLFQPMILSGAKLDGFVLD